MRKIKNIITPLNPTTTKLWSNYGHQTLEDSSSSWWATTHKVIWHFDDVVLQGQTTNQHHYIFTTRVLDGLDHVCLDWMKEPQKPLEVTGAFDYVILRDHATNYDHYVSAIIVFMATKLGRMVIQFECFLAIKINKALITWPGRVPMATKPDKMMIYLDGLVNLKSHDPLIMSPCDVTWQNKTITCLMPQC